MDKSKVDVRKEPQLGEVASRYVELQWVRETPVRKIFDSQSRKAHQVRKHLKERFQKKNRKWKKDLNLLTTMKPNELAKLKDKLVNNKHVSSGYIQQYAHL